MYHFLKPITAIFLLAFSSVSVRAQDSVIIHSAKVVSAYIESVSSMANELEDKLDKKSQKVLRKLQKQESRIKAKLSKIDSSAAISVFKNAEAKYKQLEQRLSGGKLGGAYIPSLDTMLSSLKLFDQQSEWINTAKDAKEKMSDALSKVKGLQSEFQKAETIKAFLKERQKYLKEQISKFGFAKELKKLNKQAYYYSEQLNEYKALLKDKSKREKKALELLTQTKLFKDFMRKNSLLASLMPMPVGGGGGQTAQTGFAGLQTRAQLTSFVQQVSGSGPNAMPQLQQNIQDAQGVLTTLRNKLSQLTGGGSDLDMPNFKPNAQKTKSFFQRLEYGTNIQSQKANSFFPVTSDLGLSVGYKLNDKSVIGIGASYKLGWGKGGFDNVKLSSEGVGLRSFIDWKIKGSFWITGGYEQNYRTAFNSVDQLRNLNAWQQSGLLGLTKTVSLKTKFLKQTKIQLLWDFLSQRQLPRTQSVVFRVGYSF